MSLWTHPIHARGVRSTNFAVRGQKLLTDKKIHAYAKEGFYGTEVQAAALGKPVAKKKTPARTAMQVLRDFRKKMEALKS